MTEEKLDKANQIKARIECVDEILELMDGKKTKTFLPGTSGEYLVGYKLNDIDIYGRFKDEYIKERVPDYLFPAIRNAIAEEKERLIEEFNQL